MRPTWLVVHLGRLNLSQLQPLIKCFHCVLNGLKCLHLCVLYINHACIRILSDSKLVFIHAAYVLALATMKKIIELVKIQLHHIAFKLDFKAFHVFHFLFNGKHFVKSSWNYTNLTINSVDCISLTRTRLSISKYTNIKSVNSTLNQHFGIFKDIFLTCIRAKTSIEYKFFFLILVLLGIALLEKCIVLFDSQFESKLILDTDCIDTSHFDFVLVKRSYSTVDSDLSFHVFNLIVKSFTLNSLHLILGPKCFILLVHIYILILK